MQAARRPSVGAGGGLLADAGQSVSCPSLGDVLPEVLLYNPVRRLPRHRPYTTRVAPSESGSALPYLRLPLPETMTMGKVASKTGLLLHP